MRLLVILADIHGNYAALRAVETDAHAQALALGASEIVFVSLGDVVDYGWQPNECLAWVFEHAQVYVLGNHDRVILNAMPPNEINLANWPMTLWTRCVVEAIYKERIASTAQSPGWPEAVAQPMRLLQDVTLFHSSLIGRDLPLDTVTSASQNFRTLTTPHALFGHTHVQGYFAQNESGVHAYITADTVDTTQKETLALGNDWWLTPLNTWIPLGDQRVLINPGSVGQPRFSSHLIVRGGWTSGASYALLRTDGDRLDAFQFRKVSYDVGATIRGLETLADYAATIPADVLRVQRLPDIFPGATLQNGILDDLPARLKLLVPDLIRYLQSDLAA